MSDRTCHKCVWAGDFSVCSACNGPNDSISNFHPRQSDVATPVVSPVTAPGILENAAEIMRERGKQYDQEGGERSMGKAVSAFNIIAGRDLQESEGWLLLQVLKDVRDRQTPDRAHEDSLVDNVAYAALKAEARLAGK